MGPDDEAAYQPAALGVVIAELVGKLAAEGGPVVLLGHSYGGLVVARPRCWRVRRSPA